MKVFLQTYLNNNLGDDLFVYIITNRYRNTKFEAMTLYKSTTRFNNNFKLKFRKTGRIVNKIIRVLYSNKTNLENELMKKSDLTCFIGGSMFIEYDDSLNQNFFIGGGKKYYIIGTNFGPYKTDNYYKRFYDVFKNAEDVCFREEYSYNLFKDLNTVRMAPDIAFNLDYNDPKESNKKVIISCIDCSQKSNNEFQEIYENKIIELIYFFYNKGYEITLMSFCKSEGDEKAIKSIINKMTNVDIKNSINTFFYNGNIESALETLSSSSVIVGSRFHANILGLVMNKTIIPIAYSDKTINALKDIKYEGVIIDIRNMNSFDVNSITYDDLNYKLNIKEIKQKAEKHFEKLDEILK